MACGSAFDNLYNDKDISTAFGDFWVQVATYFAKNKYVAGIHPLLAPWLLPGSPVHPEPSLNPNLAHVGSPYSMRGRSPTNREELSPFFVWHIHLPPRSNFSCLRSTKHPTFTIFEEFSVSVRWFSFWFFRL